MSFFMTGSSKALPRKSNASLREQSMKNESIKHLMVYVLCLIIAVGALGITTTNDTLHQYSSIITYVIYKCIDGIVSSFKGIKKN